MSSELDEIYARFRSIVKIAKGLYCVFIVAFVLELTLVAGSVFVIFFDIVQASPAHTGTIPVWVMSIPDLVSRVIVAYAFLACVLFARDVSRGHTPFSDVRAGRFFVAAVALLLSIVVDMMWGPIAGGISFYYDNGFFDFAVHPDDSRFLPHISVGNMAACAVLFLLSFVLRYGSILQELSDDTI